MNSRIGLIAGATAVLLLAGAAHGQIPDHLKCYRITDPLKLKALVDLESPQFGLEHCKVRGAKFFCVNAEKRVIEAIDGSTGAAIVPDPITGAPVPIDQICYKISCPAPFPPDQDVTDQFGRRTVQKLVPSILCGPARKGPPPPPDPCGQTAPACNGTCPNPTDVCTAVPGTVPQCECVSPLECGQTFPQCNGVCPATAPDCVPVTVAGASLCRCK